MLRVVVCIVCSALASALACFRPGLLVSLLLCCSATGLVYDCFVFVCVLAACARRLHSAVCSMLCVRWVAVSQGGSGHCRWLVSLHIFGTCASRAQPPLTLGLVFQLDFLPPARQLLHLSSCHRIAFCMHGNMCATHVARTCTLMFACSAFLWQTYCRL